MLLLLVTQIFQPVFSSWLRSIDYCQTDIMLMKMWSNIFFLLSACPFTTNHWRLPRRRPYF